MSADISITPRLDDLIVYLRRHGWKPESSPSDQTQVWTCGEDAVGNPIRIVLPSSSEDPYTDELIMRAIRLIAVRREDDPVVVAFNIAKRDSDVLCPRIVGKHINGSVPYRLVSDVIKGIGDLLAASATQEDNPREHFDRVTQVGKKFVERCRFGHTQRRSFGLVVECPVGLNPGGDLFEESDEVEPTETPFERRVVERVAKGLLDLRRSIQDGSPSPLTQNVALGFNANLCDALTGILETVDDLDLEFGILWSPEWRTRQMVSGFRSLRIESHSVEYLQAASRALRSDLGESKKQAIDGTIIELHSLTPPLDDVEVEGSEERTILVSRPMPDRPRPMIIEMTLDAESYRKACDAHKTGALIRATGWLEKPSRTSHHKLGGLTGFEVLSS
jgi:hypothetical protein